MKVALYARVSTDGQDPAIQLVALRAHVAQRGWQIAEEFIDRGGSGAKDRRPALDRLMKAAWAGQFQTVLVWRFDRVARSVKHLVTALETFRGLNVGFVSMQEQIDTSAPIGQAMFTIMGAMAQLERDLIRERIHGGLRKARAEGKRLGRRPAAVNRFQIAELQRQGLSYREIGRKLGIPRSTAFKYRDPSIVAGVRSPSYTDGRAKERRSPPEDDSR
jgi:DNA invertase Pin-like site-specific DNA recombinase